MRRALRNARRSATDVAAVASACGVANTDLVAALQHSTTRGRCDHAAVSVLALDRSARHQLGISDHRQANVVAHKACPPPLRRAVAHDPSITHNFSSDPHWPRDLHHTRKQFFEMLKYSTEAHIVAYTTKIGVPGVAGWEARDLHTGWPRCHVARLARSSDPIDPHFAALEGRLPAISQRSAGSAAPEVRLAAAHSADVPTQAALVCDPDPAIRRGVAGRTSTAVLLDRLAQDPDLGVLGGVARNPSTPPSTLERLSNDPDLVDWCATNPSTPPKTLRALAARSESSSVRFNAINNERWTLTQRLGLRAVAAAGRVSRLLRH